MSTKQTETIQPQAPHSLNEQEVLYIQSMTSQEKQLHELATQMLGTSYFVGKTHGFTKWFKSQQAK